MSRRRESGLGGIDWIVFSLYLALVAVGWLMIYTVGYGDGYPTSRIDFLTQTTVGKQTIFMGICFLLLLVTFVVDWKFWRTFAYLIYGVGLVSLLGVLVLGKNINGSTSWYALPGGFSLQPSEFVKFATCLAMAAFLSTYNTNLKTTQSQLTAIGLLIAPMLLILLQPDAGSALVFLSFFILLFREGMPPGSYIIAILMGAVFILGLSFEPLPVILGLCLIGISVLALNFKQYRNYILIGTLVWIGASIFFNYHGFTTYVLLANLIGLLILGALHWRNRQERLALLSVGGIVAGSILVFSTNYAFNNFLRPHQQDRINVWLNPEKCDPQGSLYNVLQSKLAIGSGGIQGKGFLQGTMTKLNYVPEQSTDFIFCTIGEEQGFIGSFMVIVLFLVLLQRLVTIAERQKAAFSRQYAYGVAGIIFLHFFVNIGMTMSIMPIIGIPLPFVSYGGSSLIGFTIMIGVLLKLDANRYLL